jgi:hypothetical protein
MDQWNGQQLAFAIKMFYKNNDSLEGAQKVLQKFPFFLCHPVLIERIVKRHTHLTKMPKLGLYSNT